MKLITPQQRGQTFMLHGIKQFERPTSFGTMVAEPIILTPKEERIQQERYNKSVGDTQSEVGTIIGSGDYPKEATPCDLERFVEQHDKIVPPNVIKDIKQHGGIFHGKHNLNNEYKRKLGAKKAEQFQQETYDYDIWVGNPKKRANLMQQRLDKAMKCDIAYAVKQPSPHDSKDRWIVRSRANMDNPEVDYVGYPDPLQHPYRTMKTKGIEHETIESSMAREETLKFVPARSFKARKSLRNYQEFKAFEQRQKRIKK